MRESIFQKAWEEILKPQRMELDFMGASGVHYLSKDYPVRFYKKEPFNYCSCGCRGLVFKPMALCKHAVAGIVLELLRNNPNLLLIDLDTYPFKIKTALEIDNEKTQN